jgi:ferrous iron transport protein B
MSQQKADREMLHDNSLPIIQPAEQQVLTPREIKISLVGNPNAGKTTLFNRLTGLTAKTSNFAGTTVERHSGRLKVGSYQVEVLDLPGLYGLTSSSAEERIAQEIITGQGYIQGSVSTFGNTVAEPVDTAVVAQVVPLELSSLNLVVIDATNLARNLYLVSEVRELGQPVIVALNMADLARKNGIEIDEQALSIELEAPVIPVSARTGEGIPQLLLEIDKQLDATFGASQQPAQSSWACGGCRGCSHAARYDWAEYTATKSTRKNLHLSSQRSEAIDRYLTHPVLGLIAFAVIMAGLFISLFALADYPMGWIEDFVGSISEIVNGMLAEGDIRSFLVDGVMAGVGGVIVFLPQICLLFFLLTLLEDTGYLSRAAFVMDRLMRRVGLPGRAFVPMLSAHACAIPAIMSTRVLDDRRDRLVTILTLPLLTCSARLPVYALVTSMLFMHQPIMGGLVFLGAYSLGIVMALLMAWCLKKTILKGESRPLMIELPNYKWPSLRNAIMISYDRGLVFIKNAGTVILVISIILWGLSTYPKLPEDQVASRLSTHDAALMRTWQSEVEKAETAKDDEAAATVSKKIESMNNRYVLEYTMAGRLGKLVEPVFKPLGFDWRIDVGILTSFAARETLVSTMAIIFGAGSDAGEEPQSLGERLKSEVDAHGKPIFSTPTCLSLLAFFVLAMQCLPTQVITKRETGSWNWAIFQFAYMTVLAYTVAFVTYQVSSLIVG